MVNVKLKDGSVIQTEEGLTVKEIAEKWQNDRKFP